MHSSVEMVTKRLYLQIGAQKKARFFSLMFFRESLCINRISHNYVILQLVFCIIMPFRTSFHIPFPKLILPFTLTAQKILVKAKNTNKFNQPKKTKNKKTKKQKQKQNKKKTSTTEGQNVCASAFQQSVPSKPPLSGYRIC